MDIVGQEHDVKSMPKISYKESLLTSSGLNSRGDSMVMDGIDENAPNPEDQWYMDAEKEDLEFDEWCKPWHNALIVKVLGKRMGLGFIEQRLRRDWAEKDEADYSHALLEGPWMIVGHYLITQIKKITAWVRIPNLPIELYNPRFLWPVGSAIGQMLKIDHTTSIHSRGRFARICVEIDLAKKTCTAKLRITKMKVPRIVGFSMILGQIKILQILALG
ncbi:hypothetical protein Ahy_B06g081430 [Arachis hypogaea]|uniref:Uncharacterized protein n=1 Tax=Arachis hypogaea TaxID=3818 RepID=A0A444YL01_ARAHY|nr:hypothetical protein Ahy_B06g081430 [Arachis hypogaea]